MAARRQPAADHVPPLVPRRRWWLALLCILLLGGGLRLTGYNFSLPYVDHPDEPNQFLAARLILDTATARSIGKHSYPPGIIALHYLFVRFWQDPAAPPATVTGPLRLIAISAGLAGLTLLTGAALSLQGLQPQRVTLYYLYMLFLVVIMPGLFSLLRGRDDRSAALAFSLLAFFNASTAFSMAQRGVTGPWLAPAG